MPSPLELTSSIAPAGTAAAAASGKSDRDPGLLAGLAEQFSSLLNQALGPQTASAPTRKNDTTEASAAETAPATLSTALDETVVAADSQKTATVSCEGKAPAPGFWNNLQAVLSGTIGLQTGNSIPLENKPPSAAENPTEETTDGLSEGFGQTGSPASQPASGQPIPSDIPESLPGKSVPTPSATLPQPSQAVRPQQIANQTAATQTGGPPDTTETTNPTPQNSGKTGQTEKAASQDPNGETCADVAAPVQAPQSMTALQALLTAALQTGLPGQALSGTITGQRTPDTTGKISNAIEGPTGTFTPPGPISQSMPALPGPQITTSQDADFKLAAPHAGNSMNSQPPEAVPGTGILANAESSIAQTAPTDETDPARTESFKLQTAEPQSVQNLAAVSPGSETSAAAPTAAPNPAASASPAPELLKTIQSQLQALNGEMEAPESPFGNMEPVQPAHPQATSAGVTKPDSARPSGNADISAATASRETAGAKADVLNQSATIPSDPKPVEDNTASFEETFSGSLEQASGQNHAADAPGNDSLPGVTSLGSGAPAGASQGGPPVATDKLPQFISKAHSLHDQVVDGTAYSVKNGHRELTIRLNPDNLGEVRVNLLASGQGDNAVLNARLIASTPESHEHLQKQIHTLKSSLEAQGIQVNSLSVVLAGQPEMGGHQHRDDHSRQTFQHQPNPHGSGTPSQNSDPNPQGQNAFFSQMNQSGQGGFQQKSPYGQAPVRAASAEQGQDLIGTDNRPGKRTDINDQGKISILA